METVHFAPPIVSFFKKKKNQNICFIIEKNTELWGDVEERGNFRALGGQEASDSSGCEPHKEGEREATR